MEQDKKNKVFHFHYGDIWSFFERIFNMEYQEIQGVLKLWLENTFKLKGYTPMGAMDWAPNGWKILSN